MIDLLNKNYCSQKFSLHLFLFLQQFSHFIFFMILLSSTPIYSQEQSSTGTMAPDAPRFSRRNHDANVPDTESENSDHEDQIVPNSPLSLQRVVLDESVLITYFTPITHID